MQRDRKSKVWSLALQHWKQARQDDIAGIKPYLVGGAHRILGALLQQKPAPTYHEADCRERPRSAVSGASRACPTAASRRMQAPQQFGASGPPRYELTSPAGLAGHGEEQSILAGGFRPYRQ